MPAALLRRTVLCVASVLLASAASADVITFGPAEVNLGQGGPGSYRTPVSNNSWQAFGIQLTGLSLYTDPLDTVDGVGVVPVLSLGQITFLQPANALSIDLLRGPGVAENTDIFIYGPSGELNRSISLPPAANFEILNLALGDNVGSIQFGPEDVTAITTIRFTPVPAPAAALLAPGLLFAARRRR